MDAETIIGELFERGCSMVIAIENKRLFYDRTLDKWVVSRGYKPTPRNDIHVGDHFWQAFAALCGATQHRVKPPADHDAPPSGCGAGGVMTLVNP